MARQKFAFAFILVRITLCLNFSVLQVGSAHRLTFLIEILNLLAVVVYERPKY